MRVFGLSAAVVLLLIASAAPARADGFITPFVGYGFGGDSTTCPSLTTCDEKRLHWGASIGSMGKVVGFEQDFAYAPNFFGTAAGRESAMLTVMSNVLFVIPAGPIRPYGVIGLGLMRPHVKLDTGALSLDKNVLGWDLGFGLNIFLTPKFGLRGDLRHLRTLQDVTLGVFGNERIDFWRGSVGITLGL
jgi:opacity protein-like surface antigen